MRPESDDADIRCRLCGGSTRRWRMSRFGLLVRCDGCGVGIDATSRDLESEQATAFGAPNQATWLSGLLLRQNARTLLARACRAAGEVRRAIEVGPGAGLFLELLRSAGVQCAFVDQSEGVAAQLRARMPGVMYVGADVRELTTESRYDLAILVHVLEHVEDPVSVLRLVRNSLRPGGVILVAVPNASAIEALLPGWTAYAPYHRWYFHDLSLSYALSRAALSLEQMWTDEPPSGWPNAVFRSLLPAGWLASLRSAVRSPPRSHEGDNPGVQGARVLGELADAARILPGLALSPLRRVQEIYGLGEQVCAIARRRDSA